MDRTFDDFIDQSILVISIVLITQRPLCAADAALIKGKLNPLADANKNNYSYYLCGEQEEVVCNRRVGTPDGRPWSPVCLTDSSGPMSIRSSTFIEYGIYLFFFFSFRFPLG